MRCVLPLPWWKCQRSPILHVLTYRAVQLTTIRSKVVSSATVAHQALQICHVNPSSGAPDPAWSERCTRACYECLLSYSNQREHANIDRQLVREYLWHLSRARTQPVTGARSREEQYRWLMSRTDPASDYERRFPTYLYEHDQPLPDHAQYLIPAVPVQPDVSDELTPAPWHLCLC
jgi:hypothetical protein